MAGLLLRVGSRTLVVPAADEPRDLDLDLAPMTEGRPGHLVVAVHGRSKDGPLPRPPARWVQVSRLALTTFHDRQALTAWVGDARTGEDVPGVRVAFLGEEGDEIRPTPAGPDGLAHLPLPEAADGVRLVVAQRGANRAFVSVADAYDRPLYRVLRHDRLAWTLLPGATVLSPGGLVQAEGFVRLAQAGPLGDLGPVTGDIRWSLTGTGFREPTAAVPLGHQGRFSVQGSVPQRAEPGGAGLRLDHPEGVSLGDGAQRLRILGSPQEALRVSLDPAEDVLVPTARPLAVTVTTASGRPIAGADVRWTVASQPGAPVLPAEAGRYAFGPPRVAYWHPRAAHHGATGLDGRHQLVLDVQRLPPGDRTWRLRVQAEVRVPGRGTDVVATELLAHPAEHAAGVRVLRAGAGTVDVDLVVVDREGRRQPGAPVQAWLTPGERCRLTTDADGRGRCTLGAGQVHNPELTVEVTDPAGRRRRTSVGMAVPDFADLAPLPLQLRSTAREVPPGEPAAVVVDSPLHPAEALLTVRRGELVGAHRLRLPGPRTEVLVDVPEAAAGGDLTLQLDARGAGGQVATGRTTLRVGLGARELAVDVTVGPKPRGGSVTPGRVRLAGAGGEPVHGASLLVAIYPEGAGPSREALLGAWSPDRGDTVATARRDTGVPQAASFPHVPDRPAGLPGAVDVGRAFHPDAHGDRVVLGLRPPGPGARYRVVALAVEGRRRGVGEALLAPPPPAVDVDVAAPGLARLGDEVVVSAFVRHGASRTVSLTVAAEAAGLGLVPSAGSVRVPPGEVREVRFRGRAAQIGPCDVRVVVAHPRGGERPEPASATARLRVLEPAEILPRASSAVRVRRRYRGLDDPRDVVRGPDGTWQIRAGARVSVEVEVAADDEVGPLSVEDRRPAALARLPEPRIVPVSTRPGGWRLNPSGELAATVDWDRFGPDRYAVRDEAWAAASGRFVAPAPIVEMGGERYAAGPDEQVEVVPALPN